MSKFGKHYSMTREAGLMKIMIKLSTETGNFIFTSVAVDLITYIVDKHSDLFKNSYFVIIRQDLIIFNMTL